MKRRRQFLVGLDEEVYIPREDRNWTPDAPVVRLRTAGQARVTASALRLRKEANTSSDVLTSMPQNAVVDVGPSNTPGWAYVEYQGFYGFASTQYLEPVGGDSPAPPPQPSPAPAPKPLVSPVPAPAKTGLGVGEKLLVTIVFLAALGIPTYMLLRKKRAYA